MTKKERPLVIKAEELTRKAIDGIEAITITQEEKNASLDKMSEVLAILGGLLLKVPKDP